MGDNKYMHNFGERILQLAATWEVEKTQDISEKIHASIFRTEAIEYSPRTHRLFSTVHLNIKFPSKPKTLWTLSERNLNSFGKRS